MNTVAQLVIEMSANMAGLQQDLSKAQNMVEGSMAKVQSAAQSAMKALTGIGVGLSVAGLAAFVRSAIDAADEMSKMSQKTGLAVQDVAGMQLAYRQAGLGADVMQTSIAKLSKSMADGSDAFTAMGLSVRNQDGTLKNTRQMIGEVSEKFAGYKDGAEKTALAMAIFGKSGAELIPLLNGGAGALDEFDAMAKKLGLTMADETTKDAEKFNDTLDLIGMGVQGVGRQVAAQLLPTLSTLAGEFFDSATSGDALKNVADVLAIALKSLYSVGVGLVQVFKTVVATLGGMGRVIGAVLEGDFALVKVIAQDFKNEVSDSWVSAGQSIANVWGDSGNKTVEALAATAKAAKKAAPEFSGVGKAAKTAADEYAQLVAKLTAKDTGFDADFAKNFGMLAEGGKKAGLSIAEIIRLQDLLLAQQPAIIKQKKDEAAVDEARAKLLKALADEARKQVDGEFKAVDSLTAKAQAQEFANQAFDKGRSVVEELTLVEMQRRLTMLDSTESVIPGMVLATEQQIDAQKRLIKALKEEEALQKAKKDQDAFKSLIDGVDKAGFDGLFNGSLKGVSKLIESVKLLGKLQTDGEKARIGAAVQYGETSEEYAAALKGIEQDKQRVSLQTYSAMAGAAKGFFKEGTEGYKAMEIAETSFALAAAVSAILTQGKGDPYTAIPRMLAVAALVMQLGVQLNGLSAGKAPAPTNQGTGTVFGDSSAKSASIENSIDLLANTSLMGLKYSAQMANSLKAIEAAMTGVTSLLLRGGQLGDLAASIPTGSFASSTSDFGNKLFGSKFSDLRNKLFGNKVSIKGTGIVGDAQSFGGIDQLGFQGSYYADVVTQKKFLGITTKTINSTVLEALDEQMAKQFGLIFRGIGDTVTAAAGALDLELSKVKGDLAGYIVDIGRIDLNGLNGAQIQEKLAAVFGAQGDKIAQAVVGGLEPIQRVGEGYLETLVRAANQLEVVNQNSIRMADGFRAVGVAGAVTVDALVQQFGGLDEYTSATDGFFESFFSAGEKTQSTFLKITGSLDGFNLSLPANAQAWRDLTLSMDRTTSGGREAYEALVRLGPAFSDLQKQLLSDAGVGESDLAGSIRDGLLRRVSQEDLGGKLSDVLKTGLENALANGVSEQISASLTNQIIAPMLQTIMLGGDLALAVSQENIDEFAAKAKTQIENFSAVLASPAVQTAMQQLQQGISGITGSMSGLTSSVSGLTSSLDSAAVAATNAGNATRYIANAADIAYQNDPMLRAAEAAVQAGYKAKEAWEAAAKTIEDEVKRLRGGSVLGQSRSFLESQFAIGNAQARAGDVAALVKLPEISKALEEATRKTSLTSLEFKTAIARQAATLEQTIYGGGAGAAYQSGNSGAAVVVPGAVAPFVGAAGTGVFADVAQEVRSLREQVRQQGDRIAELQTENNRRTKDISDTLTRVTRAGNAVVTVPLS